jgi:hypothetical protein
MASRSVKLELDDEAQAAIAAIGEKIGIHDLAQVLRTCIGGYAALLHYLDTYEGSKLGLVLKNGDWVEVELLSEGTPLEHVAPVIPLFPLEESDHEIEEFLNETDEPFAESPVELAENCDGEFQEVTQQKVDEALDTALENGNDYRHYDNHEALAIDLGTYAQRLEGAEPEQLIPLIKDWQARNQ